jgi:hypothetical protein
VTLHILVAGVLALPPLLVRYFPAGDLQSHLYNAWLVERIGRAELPGLFVVRQWTNVLLDEATSVLLRAMSPEWALRFILVGIAEGMFWSALLLCRRLTRNTCWSAAPVLAMLTYGWTFHMGFGNFLLALVGAFTATALAAGDPLSRARWGLIAALLLVTSLASVIPVGLAITAMACLRLRKAFPHRATTWTAVIAILALVGGLAMGRLLPSQWTWVQWKNLSGADQLYVFDGRYRWFAAALFALWCWGLVEELRARDRAGRRPWPGDACALAVIAVAGSLFVPSIVHLPGQNSAIAYLAERLSLVVAVLVTASVLATFSWPRFAVTCLVAASYFGTLTGDWLALSSFAERVASAVRTLPPDARVLGHMGMPPARVPAIMHSIDRACIGRCLSVGNYEPPSQVFRVRAGQDTHFQLSGPGEVDALEAGDLVLPGSVAPAWWVLPCSPATGSVCIRSLNEGDRITPQCFQVLTRSPAPACTG